MDRQEAIKTLVAAGNGDRAAEVIDEVVDQANAAYASIRSDRDLNDDAKRRQLAAQYAAADQRLTDRLVAMAQNDIRSDRDDAERVFGIKGLPGDPASLVISRRDAADRVAGVSGNDLRELLTRATRSGDEVLARAVVEKAVLNGDAATVNQFTADRPQLEAATERLWAAERASSQTIGFSMRMLGFRPNELNGMTATAAAVVARG